MAGLNLLDGTNAVVDFTVPTTPGGTATSLKCWAGFLSLRIDRDTSEKITFCSSSWAVPISGIRRGFGHIDGFASTGTPLSSPTILILNDLALPFTFTADTGNLLAWSLMVTTDAMGVRAFGEFTRGIDFRTSGAPTPTWVIT
jgi:hypothetical protein